MSDHEELESNLAAWVMGALDREEAEERYGDYVDLVETGTEILADLRDNFATTLEEDASDEYEQAFNQAVLRRFRRFALEIEDR